MIILKSRHRKSWSLPVSKSNTELDIENPLYGTRVSVILRDLANPIYDSSDVNQWGGMKIMPSKNSTQTGVLPFGGVHMEKETAGQSVC